MTRLLATAYLLLGALSALDGYSLGGLDPTKHGPAVIAECHIDDIKACRCHTTRPTMRLWAGSRVNRSGGRQGER